MTSGSIATLIQKKNELSNKIVDLLEDDSPDAMQTISSLKRERKRIDEQITELSHGNISFSSVNHLSLPNLENEESVTNMSPPRISLPRPSMTRPLPSSSTQFQDNLPLNQIASNVNTSSCQVKTTSTTSDNHIYNNVFPESVTQTHDPPMSSHVMKTPKTPLHALKNPDQFLKTYYHEPDFLYWSRMDFPWIRNVKKAMKLMFRIISFRKNQAEIVNAAMSGHDVFVLMPTGGGKSICYQVKFVFYLLEINYFSCRLLYHVVLLLLFRL